MITLPMIPQPYPEEILGSWLARIKHLNQSGAWEKLKTDCGFSPGWPGCFDIPDESTEYEKLFHVLSMSFEEVLRYRTTFPYFSAIGSSSELIKGTKYFKIHNSKRLSKLGVTRLPSASTLPKYCPMCVSSDAAEFGEPYWHREHQLPNVYYCVSHKFLLRATCGICQRVIAGIHRNARLTIKCECGKSLCDTNGEREPVEHLLSLSNFSVQGLLRRRSHKKTDILKFINYIRRDLGGSHSGATWASISRYYSASYTKKHSGHMLVANPAGIDYEAVFLIETSIASSPISWVYAVLLGLGASWSEIDAHIDLPPPVVNIQGRRAPIKERIQTISNARAIVEDMGNVASNQSIPRKVYWFLALYDFDWLKNRFTQLKPVANVSKDRRAIAAYLLTRLEERNISLYSTGAAGPFVRAELRDSLWLKEIIQQFHIASEPGKESYIFAERVGRVRHALEILKAEEGPPKKIEVPMIAEKIGLPAMAVQAIISKDSDLKTSLDSLRENFLYTRLSWALRQIIQQEKVVSASSLAEVLGVSPRTGSDMFELIKQMARTQH